MPYSFVVWRRDRAFFIAIAKAVVFLCPRAERRKKMVEKIIEELRKVLGTEYSLRSEVVHRYNRVGLATDHRKERIREAFHFVA